MQLIELQQLVRCNELEGIVKDPIVNSLQVKYFSVKRFKLWNMIRTLCYKIFYDHKAGVACQGQTL